MKTLTILLTCIMFTSCMNKQLYYSKVKYNEWLYNTDRYNYLFNKLELNKRQNEKLLRRIESNKILSSDTSVFKDSRNIHSSFY